MNLNKTPEQSFSGTIRKIKLLKTVKPQEEWVALFRANLAMRIKIEQKRELLAGDTAVFRNLSLFWKAFWRPKHYLRVVYAASLTVALFLLGGGVTVWAAMKSLPGSAFYPLKIVLENMRLYATSGESRYTLQSEMTSRRLEELKTVVNSGDSLESKAEKLETVVQHIQQQLIADKKQLPVIGVGETENSIKTIKEVSQRAEQVKKTINEVKESLAVSETGNNLNLNEKLAEVSATAEKTSFQALETLIAKTEKTDVERQDILAKFGNLIQEKEKSIIVIDKITDGKISAINQATTTVYKLPINAVLVNQADEARLLLERIENDLKEEDFVSALQTLRALNEIVKGAEAIVQNSGNKEALIIDQAAVNLAATTSAETLIEK